MSDSGVHNLAVANLSDDYIRDLKSENQRYDITLAQDFVISVLPNGIKTWAFVYDFQGRNRRRTLGVFPEMSFSEAKIALENARQVMIRMDEPTVPPEEFGTRPAVLGGSHYVAKQRPRKSGKLKWLILIALIAAVGTGGWFYVSKQDPVPENSDETQFDSSRPFGASQPTSPADKPVKPTPVPDNVPKALTPAPPDKSEKTAPKIDLRSVDGGHSAPVTRASSASTGAIRSATAAPAPVPAPVRTAASNPRPDKPATSVPAKSSVPAGGATAMGGRVSRSVLTSRVKDLEPTDVIGPEVSYKDSGYTRVFYFTELREFSDGNVLHRWERNGQLEEEVLLKVRKSWRWRTFSNKDIPPGLTGEWKVMTIDASGTVLDTETFTYGY